MCKDAPPPPTQVTYGEGLAESLKAQAEFLKGTGDFAKIGSLESLLPLEESIRKKTAQTDTDILRQTLLGGETQVKVVRDPETGKFGIPDGEIVTKSSGPSAGRYQMINIGSDRFGPNLRIVDTKTGGVMDQQNMLRSSGMIAPFAEAHPTYESYNPSGETRTDNLGNVYGTRSQYEELKRENKDTPTGKAAKQGIGLSVSAGGWTIEGQASQKFITQQFEELSAATPTEIQQTFNWIDPNTGEEFDPSQEGQTITTREGTGMVDILGDTRFLQDYETKVATQEDVTAGLADEVGDSFVTQRETQRKAGFDEYGNFQGLSVLAEDIQRGSLSRQREADLQDVSRLSGLYGDIMEDYKPGTASAMQGAKDLIEEQKGNLLRDVGISDPERVAFQGTQADPLRQGLMTQAEEALGQGLTDREERQIAESARARSTLMGRTFDQSGTIAEAEARVLEDNQRRMQNRAFAQSVLGQEAGIQTADDTRRMGGEQFNVASKMDAERLRESLRQQGLLGYLDAASRISQIENQDRLDPFQAILGRGGGTALQQGQSVLGQAGYGLQSAPQYLNPEAGLGFIQNQATNAANIYSAQVQSDAEKQSGIFGGVTSLATGLGKAAIKKYCWVAREVYGVHNPAWIAFRYWMLNKSPSWFRAIYIKFGERFAQFISNKPRLKARIRLWMDTKIGRT